jgi:maleate isomerase
MDVCDITLISPPLDLEDAFGLRRIGLLLLATDQVTERDFARIFRPDEVGVHVSRIAFENPTTPKNLTRMQPRLTGGTALILPGEALDALYFGCTSASVIIGDETIEAAIQVAKLGVPVITPSRAALAAFEALGIRRISILTPYLRETSVPLVGYFQAREIEVVNVSCLGLADDREMARISPATITEVGCEAMAPEAQALFVSCTALQAFEAAAEIERRIGRPVVTSNQAGIWCVLRKLGIGRSIDGYGRLLDMPLQVASDLNA